MNISTGADKEQFPYGLGRTAAAKKQTEEKGPRTDAFSSWLSLFDDLQTVVCFFYFFFQMALSEQTLKHGSPITVFGKSFC